ncbi:MAG: sporulation protein YtxC [Desulfitobacteriia bacterium]|jgi:putative sporulation protein YtxC
MPEYYVEVGTTAYKEYLFRKLSDLRAKEGLPIDIYELKNGAHYLVRCVYSTIKGKREQDRLTVRIYNYYFARALAEIISQEWEGGFVQKILKKEYSLRKEDIADILQRAWRQLNREEQTYLPETRKHVLVKAILEFLECNPRIDIEGFMNFRADIYKRELRKQVARAVNEYTLEQEHESFIRILRRFLHTQRSIYKSMHLVIKGQGKVLFFDDRGRNVNHDLLQESYVAFQEAARESFSPSHKSSLELYEDLLISSLLKCAPQKLIIHNTSEQHIDLVSLVQEVFEAKVSYCPGCFLCLELD